jgi:hypothetical protein
VYRSVFSQDDDNFDDIELTQEQWEAVRDTFAVYAIKHLARLDTLNLQIDSLKQLNRTIENYDCEKELYAIVGATKEDVAEFRRKFEETEKKVNGKIGSPDDARQMYFNEIERSKIRCLPEFADRYAKMSGNLALMSPENKTSEGTYEVARGDCLWLISKMKYNTPYLWPAIWDANKSVIINPDLIYPGQVLKIPQMSEAQRKEAEEKSKKKIKRFRRLIKNKSSDENSFKDSQLFKNLKKKLKN